MTTMRKLLVLTGILGIMGTLVAISRTATNGSAGTQPALSAAFRDGAYLGKLAAKQGETPKPPVGRWAAPSDRASFVAGYYTAYRRIVSEAAGKNLNTNAAFRDGLYLGKLDAEQGRTQHVSSARWSRTEDRASFRLGYHQAYEETARLRGVKIPLQGDLVQR
jgi:hypothetical protein